MGDLRVNVFSGYRKVVTFRQQVTDVDQKRFIRGSIDRLTGTLAVPGIDLFLDRITLH